MSSAAAVLNAKELKQMDAYWRLVDPRLDALVKAGAR